VSKINRVHWTYVGNKANSLIELKHFLESGNLVIFCNQHILLTDFDVFGDTEYSFFLEQELCRITIKKRPDNQLAYNFKIVEDIDTPLNRFRKKRSRKYLIQSLLAIGGVMLLLATLIVGGYFLNQYYVNKDLRENGIAKSVQVRVEPHVHEGKFYNAYYTFNYRNRHQAKHLKLPINTAQELITPNGLPLHDRDEFLLTFSSVKPERHRLNFNVPTEKQVNTYRQRIFRKIDPDSLNVSYNDCFLKAVYQTKGTSGWADIFYQDVTPKTNKKHHRDSYQKLIKNPTVKQLTEKCVRGTNDE